MASTTPQIASDYDFDGDDQISRSRFTRIVLYSIIGLTILAILVLVVGQFLAAPIAMFRLQANPYALLSGAGLISSVTGLIFLLARTKRHTLSLTWFAIVMALLAIWSLAEMMMRLSATPEMFNFWAPISTIGSGLISPAVVLFALTYAHSRYALHPGIIILLFAGAFGILYADFRTDLIDNYRATDLILSPWGYNLKTGPLYLLLVAWDAILILMSVAFIFRYGKNSRQPEVKAQARMIGWGIAAPIMMAVITDGIMPALAAPFLPPLGTSLTCFTGVIVTYAILHYRYLTFTPSFLAGQVLSTMNEAVLGLDKDFTINYANTAAERLLGAGIKPLIGRSLSEYDAKPRTRTLTNAIIDSLHDRAAAEIESIDIRSSESHKHTVKLSATKVLEHSATHGYIIVCTDISQISKINALISRQVTRQTAEIRKTRMQLITAINSVEFGFILCDDQPEVILVNDVAHRLFCDDPDHAAVECPNIHLATFSQKAGSWSRLISELQASLKSHKPRSIGAITSSRRTWKAFVSPVLEGDSVTGAAIILQDITEQQILERSRDEFFSIASHELRTPLTSIRGNAAMLLSMHGDDMKHLKSYDMVEDIHQSSIRLIDIVNDFLDVSRIEQGKIAYSLGQVRVGEVIRSILYEMDAIIRDKHLSLVIEETALDKLPPVTADENRLKQVIYNLLSNAVKFTDHGTITITTKHHPVKRTVEVFVKDSGSGIPAHNQNLLFHKFQQAGDSLLTRDTTKGTGLGLYISRLLMEGMGGSLRLVRSREGEGTEFGCELQVAAKSK